MTAQEKTCPCCGAVSTSWSRRTTAERVAEIGAFLRTAVSKDTAVALRRDLEVRIQQLNAFRKVADAARVVVGKTELAGDYHCTQIAMINALREALRALENSGSIPDRSEE